MTRDEVCQEFGAWYRGQVPEEVHWSAAEAMADEIVRLRDEVVRLDNTVIALSEESRMMRKEFAEVREERDAMAAVVDVLRQYYQRKADDDQLYDAFCTWRTAVSTVNAAEREVAP